MGVIRLILKTISIIVSISFIVSLLFGYFVYKDINDLRANWPDSDKLVLLANDKIYAGMITTFSDTEEAPTFIENLEDYQTAYENEDYDTIKGSNYKLFILKVGMFEKTDESFDLGGFTVTKKDAIEAIESDSPVEAVIDSLVLLGELPEEQKELLRAQLNNEGGGDLALKGVLFGLLLQDAMSGDALFLIKEIQNGNIVVYPEGTIFKLVRLAPISLIESLAKKVISQVEEKLEQ